MRTDFEIYFRLFVVFLGDNCDESGSLYCVYCGCLIDTFPVFVPGSCVYCLIRVALLEQSQGCLLHPVLLSLRVKDLEIGPSARLLIFHPGITTTSNFYI